jgi:MinD-like ATPase involved in chromosome partitioning or flagellar assembly
MATPESGLYLIPASVRINDISKILREGYDVELLNDGFQDLLESLKLDYLFIDTHPGLSEETLLSLTVSDLVILILRPDQQDFQGTAVTIDVARKLNVQKLLLLVNKALPEFNFDELQKKIADTFQIEVAGVLPESSDIIRLASSGIFCLNFPDHQISKVYRHVASLI